jgi:hypothetical protein
LPTNQLEIVLNFNQSRTCRNPTATVESASDRSPLPPPDVVDGGKQLRLSIKRPVLGANYEIRWSW